MMKAGTRTEMMATVTLPRPVKAAVRMIRRLTLVRLVSRTRMRAEMTRDSVPRVAAGVVAAIPSIIARPPVEESIHDRPTTHLLPATRFRTPGMDDSDVNNTP